MPTPLIERPYRLLALGPVVAILGAPWMADRIEPRILGLPFLLAWIAGWVVATSLVMWLIWTLDRRRDAQTRATAR